MGFVINRNTGLRGNPVRHFEDPEVFWKIEAITTGVAVDEQGLERGRALRLAWNRREANAPFRFSDRQ